MMCHAQTVREIDENPKQGEASLLNLLAVTLPSVGYGYPAKGMLRPPFETPS